MVLRPGKRGVSGSSLSGKKGEGKDSIAVYSPALGRVEIAVRPSQMEEETAYATTDRN